MDALIRAIGKPVLFLVSPLLATVLAAPQECLADCSAVVCAPWYCSFVDGATLCAWHRTWHGPNALDTPLRGYYVPRPGACCDFDDYAGRYGDGSADYYMLEGAEGLEADGPLPTEAEIGLEPARFERMGSLPNDLELAPGLPEGSPGRSDR